MQRQRMSTAKFNELWEEAIRRHVADGGWVGKPEDPAAKVAARMLQEHLEEQVMAVERKLALELATADSIMAEWDAELPRLQGPDPHMQAAGWGHSTVEREVRWNPTKLHAPTMGSQQPSYDFQCYQCGLPITDRGRNRWTDHGGKTVCQLTFVDPIDVATESYWIDHQPKPWHGEEDDDDDSEW